MTDRIIVDRNPVRIIHQMEQGPAGPPGLDWLDEAWGADTDYTERQALAHGGGSYRCTANHTSAAATEPGVGASWQTVWAVVAEKGEAGAAGADGADGADGTTIVFSDTEPILPVGGMWARPIDTTPPTVTDFTLPATATSLTVDITTLTATDNRAVAKYMVGTSSVKPSPSDPGWSVNAPTTVTFPGQGTQTAYAWAMDEAGNISDSLSDTVEITLPNQAPSATVTASAQSVTGFTAAGIVFGIGAGDSVNKIRVVWMLQGTDTDVTAAIVAGRYTDLTSSGDKTAYQGAGKAISATLTMGQYIPAVQITENMSGGGTQTGEFVTGAAFTVSLNAPTGVAAAPGNEKNTISWNAAAGALTYNVYWTKNGDTPAVDQATDANHGKITGAVSPQLHSSLTNGTLYKYGVTSVNAGGESVISDIVSATPAVQEIVVNGGFETGDLTGWSNIGTAGVSSVSGVAADKYEGNYGLKMVGVAGAAEKYGTILQTFTSNLNALQNFKLRYKVVGAECSLTDTMSTDGNEYVYVQLRVYDSLNANILNGRTLMNIGLAFGRGNSTEVVQKQSQTVLDQWCLLQHDLKALITTYLAAGKTWADVAKVELYLGGMRIGASYYKFGARWDNISTEA